MYTFLYTHAHLKTRLATNEKNQGLQNYLKKKSDESRWELGQWCCGELPTVWKHPEISLNIYQHLSYLQEQGWECLETRFSWAIPVRQKTLWEQCFLCCSTSSPRKHIDKKKNQNNWIYTKHLHLYKQPALKGEKKKNQVFIFYYFFSSNLKKKIMSRQFLFYPDQFINPKS